MWRAGLAGEEGLGGGCEGWGEEEGAPTALSPALLPTQRVGGRRGLHSHPHRCHHPSAPRHPSLPCPLPSHLPFHSPLSSTPPSALPLCPPSRHRVACGRLLRSSCDVVAFEAAVGLRLLPRPLPSSFRFPSPARCPLPCSAPRPLLPRSCNGAAVVPPASLSPAQLRWRQLPLPAHTLLLLVLALPPLPLPPPSHDALPAGAGQWRGRRERLPRPLRLPSPHSLAVVVGSVQPSALRVGSDGLDEAAQYAPARRALLPLSAGRPGTAAVAATELCGR